LRRRKRDENRIRTCENIQKRERDERWGLRDWERREIIIERKKGLFVFLEE